MLREADRGNTVNGDSQNGNEQVDAGDPIGKKRPGEGSIFNALFTFCI